MTDQTPEVQRYQCTHGLFSGVRCQKEAVVFAGEYCFCAEHGESVAKALEIEQGGESMSGNDNVEGILSAENDRLRARVKQLEGWVRDLLQSDKEFMAGVRRGLKARREGHLVPWEGGEA